MVPSAAFAATYASAASNSRSTAAIRSSTFAVELARLKRPPKSPGQLSPRPASRTSAMSSLSSHRVA